MSGYYHVGDEVTQYGNRNVGIIKNQGPADPQSALRDMINLVQVLRGQVSATDRQVLDESMSTIATGNHPDKGTLRRALGSIAGIAAIVGEIGIPVIDAVRKVTAAFGL